MRAGIVVNVTRADRHRLEAIVSDRGAPQKHVWRANIILATADGCGTAEVMRRSGKSKPVVWRWQARFMAEGVEGLMRDKTRKPGKQPLSTATVQKVVELTLGPPPGEATHWTGRMIAKAAGVSLRSVQRILEAHQLAPHRIRTFKLSTDPKFAEKFTDVVGLYVDPPAHAVVLSVDEKSQIQALDRTQPGLPMKPGRAGTMTHDYKRHGTTTLFAALNILDGTVIGRNMQRHRHQEFIRFLNQFQTSRRTLSMVRFAPNSRHRADISARLACRSCQGAVWSGARAVYRYISGALSRPEYGLISSRLRRFASFSAWKRLPSSISCLRPLE